jgi:hypothetical protein
MFIAQPVLSNSAVWWIRFKSDGTSGTIVGFFVSKSQLSRDKKLSLRLQSTVLHRQESLLKTEIYGKASKFGIVGKTPTAKTAGAGTRHANNRYAELGFGRKLQVVWPDRITNPTSRARSV